MAWVIAIGGIILLVILHEAGHFAAAKAAGMRVERFSLFFPPTLFKFKRGETEYAIGAIPAGGYVKITGMSPEEMEELEPELRERSYYAQAPWKRILVILAGPGTNILIAFAIFTVVLMAGTVGGATTISNIAPQVNTLAEGTSVDALATGGPAYGKLRIGDQVLKVDGRIATHKTITEAITRDKCAGPLQSECRAARPINLEVVRSGRHRVVSVYPTFDGLGGMVLGVSLTKTTVAALSKGYPAYGVLHTGDRIVLVDGAKATAGSIIAAIHRYSCAGRATPGCRASVPLMLTIVRSGARRTIEIYPRYTQPVGSMSLDIALVSARPFGLLSALGASGETMWSLTESTVTGLVHALTSSKARKNVSGIVGITQVTEEAVALGPVYGFLIIGFVSLVLGVINLFPFLPLDGGHVLWSVAERVRGARISTQAMWKFSSVGIVVLVFLMFTGLSNNINHLAGG